MLFLFNKEFLGSWNNCQNGVFYITIHSYIEEVIIKMQIKRNQLIIKGIPFHSNLIHQIVLSILMLQSYSRVVLLWKNYVLKFQRINYSLYLVLYLSISHYDYIRRMEVVKLLQSICWRVFSLLHMVISSFKENQLLQWVLLFKIVLVFVINLIISGLISLLVKCSMWLVLSKAFHKKILMMN